MFFQSPCKLCLVKACCTQICKEKDEFTRKHVKFADLAFGRIPVLFGFLVLLHALLK